MKRIYIIGERAWALEPSRGFASDDFMALLPAPDSLKSPFMVIALPVRSGFKISPSLTGKDSSSLDSTVEPPGCVGRGKG